MLARSGMQPRGPAAIPGGSPDGAKRHPGSPVPHFAPLNAGYTRYNVSYWTLSRGGHIDAPDDPGRVPAGAELHQHRELVAPSGLAHRQLVARVLPAPRPRAGGGQIPPRLLR